MNKTKEKHTHRKEPVLDTKPRLVIKRGTQYFMEDFLMEDMNGYRVEKRFYVRPDNPEPRERACVKAQEHAEAHGLRCVARIWQPHDWMEYYARHYKA